MKDVYNPLNMSEELIAKANAVHEYTHKGAVTVDYICKDAILCGKRFSVGQLACEVLNIPDNTINELLDFCSSVIPLVSVFYYNDSQCEVSAQQIEAARIKALEVVNILKTVRPFSYFKPEEYIKDFNLLKSPASSANNSIPAIIGESSFALSTIINTLGIGGSLAEFKRMITPIVEGADSDSSNRSVCGYAHLFEKHFSDASLTNGQWLPFATVTQKHIAVDGIFGKRIEFMNFAEMLASDFIEGLESGHAPKKCRMCGRYFLTTDAHHPHYCNEVSPGDARGRTCRKLAKLKGSTEKAQDNPRIVIKNKALANLRQAKARKSVSETEYDVIYNLINEKCQRAAERTDYCNGAYKTEMSMKNLKTEAGRLIAC